MGKVEEYAKRLSVHSIRKIPFILVNGIKYELTYDIAYRLPKFILGEVYGYVYNKLKR
jgi:hypothetical protein